MSLFNTIAFLVYPYICLTIFVVGFIYRYYTDPLTWNARSSELLDKGSLKYGSMIFHYGILLTFIGHAGGMVVPQSLYTFLGFSPEAHMKVAVLLGIPFGFMAAFGMLWLMWRRAAKSRVRVNSPVRDWITLLLLFFVVVVGFRNVLFGHYSVLDTAAPWVRSLVIFQPEPALMENVPWAYKLHILGAFTFFAYSPASRMVHAWSYPFTYITRGFILYRRHLERDNS